MNKLIVLIGFILTLWGCDCLQTVSGTIKDASTGDNIVGATVQKENDAATLMLSDSLGNFTLSDITGKANCPFMKVTVEKDGYRPITVSIPNDGQLVIELSQ